MSALATARRVAARVVVCAMILGSAIAALREVVGRTLLYGADDDAGVARAHGFLLPDADVVAAGPGETPAARAVAALALRPRDPRLLAAAAGARRDPYDDEALALRVVAARAAPYDAPWGVPTGLELLDEGRRRAIAAVAWADRVARLARAPTAPRPDRAAVEEEAARRRSDAVHVLEAVLALDAGIAATAPGRAPLTEAGAEARRLLDDLGVPR